MSVFEEADVPPGLSFGRGAQEGVHFHKQVAGAVGAEVELGQSITYSCDTFEEMSELVSGWFNKPHSLTQSYSDLRTRRLYYTTFIATHASKTASYKE